MLCVDFHGSGPECVDFTQQGRARRTERKAMTRDEILAKARQCVSGERDQDYGTPENSFGMIAELWNVYARCVGAAFTPKDVAAMLALLKIARIATGISKDDNWIDLAGYAACGGELDTPIR